MWSLNELDAAQREHTEWMCFTERGGETWTPSHCDCTKLRHFQVDRDVNGGKRRNPRHVTEKRRVCGRDASVLVAD